MKIIIRRYAFFLLVLTLMFCSTNSFGQKEFTKLTAATDSTFGYTVENPLKLKKGNAGKSIDNSHKFLSGLRTFDNQTLSLLYRTSTSDPAYKEPRIRINNRQTGLPLGGKMGILDKYVFVTSTTKDTVTLFVDIYNKGNLFLPVGLKYE